MEVLDNWDAGRQLDIDVATVLGGKSRIGPHLLIALGATIYNWTEYDCWHWQEYAELPAASSYDSHSLPGLSPVELAVELAWGTSLHP